MRSIWIGYEPREEDAFVACMLSLRACSNARIPIEPILLGDLKRRSLYHRPTLERDGRLWDVRSGAPMSTEFAISRFFTPMLAGTGWALFMDCDMLIRGDIEELFQLADPQFAVQVVKHQHRGTEGFKMDGQIQTAYPRKNWSSVMLFNVDHPSNQRLTPGLLNHAPGRDLHAFCWLEDHEIGELPSTWNHLVGVDPPDPEARIAHFTLGIPSMPGYENCEFASEWLDITSRYRLTTYDPLCPSPSA